MEKTLLIMAAGMGSRFGGLKQMEPVGPNGEFIVDYSIYDAIRNGFTKVVFIIKEEMYDDFRNTIGKRIENKIPVSYAFQRIEDLPNGYSVPNGRTKPWGTAQAILSAKSLINEPFAIINADDFYGNDAYKVLSKFIDNINEEEYAIVGYNVLNTLTENGSVKRGICKINNNKLEYLDESIVEIIDGTIHATSLVTDKESIITNDTLVSMNMMAFTPDIFNYIENNFIDFLETNKDNIEKSEYLIPTLLTKGINEGYCNASIIGTTAKWVGVTYKEDKDSVVNYINELINNGEYSKDLWN